MPYRPTPEHRRNVPGVVLPLTLAICNVYGIRAQDGATPIGAFYTEHVSRDRWVPLGGIWYQPVGEQEIQARSPNPLVVEAFESSIRTGEPVQLQSGTVVTWEPIPEVEASQLPPPLAR